MAEARFFTWGMRVALASAGALVGAAFVLFVAPGHAIYLLGDWPFGRLFGTVHGDNLLPIAMQVQILWAPALPVAYAVIRGSLWQPVRRAKMPAPAKGLAVGAAFLLALYGWAVLLALFFHSQLGRPDGG